MEGSQGDCEHGEREPVDDGGDARLETGDVDRVGEGVDVDVAIHPAGNPDAPCPAFFGPPGRTACRERFGSPGLA